MLALFFVAVCAFVIYRLHLRSKLNARIEAIRAAGYPVTCEELNEWYSIPDDAENAADMIMRAFSLYVDAQDVTVLPEGRESFPPRTEPFPEETIIIFKQYISDNRKTLELFHTAVANEHCRYPVNFDDGPYSLLPHLQHFKPGVVRLNVEAIVHAETEPSLSVRSIVSGFSLTRSLENEPLLVSQVHRANCQNCIVLVLEHLVNRIDFTDQQLRELSRAVVEARAPQVFPQSYIGERCIALAVFEEPALASQIPKPFADSLQALDLELNLSPLAFAMRKFTGQADKSTLIYLDLIDDYLEAVRLPDDESRKAVEDIGARCDKAWKDDFVLSDVLPPLVRVPAIEKRAMANLNNAQTALAIQRYRLTYGKLPVELSDLVNTYLECIPKDPFDGEELRYNKLDPGFVVYSIGEDLSDDGGRERPAKTVKDGKPVKWDVTFIVER